MATALTRAAGSSNKQKGRPIAGGGLSIGSNSSKPDYSVTDRRVQRLVERYGLTERRARVAADLIWGAADA